MKHISLFFLKHPLSACDIHYAIISLLIYDHNIFIATAVMIYIRNFYHFFLISEQNQSYSIKGFA